MLPVDPYSYRSAASFSTEITAKDWVVKGCWDCNVTVHFRTEEKDWQTTIRHGKLSWPLWGEIRTSSDNRYLFVPYYYSKFLDPAHYELIRLDVAQRREKRVEVSETEAQELGWIRH